MNAKRTGEAVRVAASLREAEQSAVNTVLRDFAAKDVVRRVWAHDKSVWTGADEDKWLGWLDAVPEARKRLDELNAFAQSEKTRSDVVLIGMGGSSLGPETVAESFGPQPGWPRFHMIDSTDPAQVNSLAAVIDRERALFIVSSKSGGTLEPNILKDYFFARVAKRLGAEPAGGHFVAVTDPGSSLDRVAKQEDFLKIFFGDPAIGGRYSVLSPFGLVPAAAVGVDVGRLIDETEKMTTLCRAADGNPGLALGVALGVLATQFRRDKVTIFASPRVASLGAWLEQLIAESTGKQGKGLIPIDGEAIAEPARYGSDRVFLYVALNGDDDAAQSRAVDALAAAGHPVFRLVLADICQLGQVFFLTEFATAIAGAVIGINPFDQPDVEASKIKTRALTDDYEKTGKLAAETPTPANLAEALRTLFAQAKPGDYAALLAYIERDRATAARLAAMQKKIRDATKLATCVGFGPRFLHSTGQAYKGGPNSGIFLQITCDPAQDVPVPGKKYSFGVVEAAQAQGDLAVLRERGRRVLRLHFTELNAGLDALSRALDEAFR